MSEKPTDGQHRLALRERHARVRMPEVVKADITQIGFRPNAIPDQGESRCGKKAVRYRRGEYPGCPARQGVEDVARSRREPDRARPDLAVG